MIVGCVRREISFERLVEYWKEVDHFEDLNKIYKPIIKKLGPFKSIDNPRYKCYGLFNEESMIGATQLVEWNSAVGRFRTINIRKEWRNQNLGWCLLEESFNQDWSDHMSMFGWLKINKLNWAQNLGFTTIGDEKDNHIGVIREMRK